MPIHDDLYTKLRDFGYVLIFKPTIYGPEGVVKGNCDAELVLNAMIEYPNYDKAVIVSGDGDFYCLVQYLLENGKLQKVLVPNQNKYSALLKRFAKKNIAFMNDLKNKIGLK